MGPPMMEKTEHEIIRILKKCEVFVGLDTLRAEKPDLMILDMIMFEMDGFTVVQKLKDPRWVKYARIPIRVLTSVREDVNRRRYELETDVSYGC